MSAWHWQQVPPGLLTARPSQLGPEQSAHSSIYEYVVWCTSDIDELFRFIYRPALRWGRWCHFFRHAMRWKQSDHHVAQVTQTHTHTHTRMHARTYFFRNDEKGRVMLFFLCLFSFFSLCLRVSLGSLAIHLVFSSCGTQAQTHHGTNKQTNKHKHTQQSRLHMRPCTETCVLVTGAESQHPAERVWWCSRILFLGAAFILIQFSFGLSAPFLSLKYLIQSS